jgi:hypothetical protein
MKRTVLSPLFALATVAAVVLAVAAAVAADAPRRTKMACGPYLESVKKTGAAVKFIPKIVAGSWGNVPPDLQKLPPGAQNCGTVEGQPTIVSPAFGKDLETFYAPLFAKVGCEPFTCEVETAGSAVRTKCKCKTDKAMGMVVTDTGNEAYSLSLFTFGGRKK